MHAKLLSFPDSQSLYIPTDQGFESHLVQKVIREMVKTIVFGQDLPF